MQDFDLNESVGWWLLCQVFVSHRGLPSFATGLLHPSCGIPSILLVMRATVPVKATFILTWTGRDSFSRFCFPREFQISVGFRAVCGLSSSVNECFPWSHISAVVNEGIPLLDAFMATVDLCADCCLTIRKWLLVCGRLQ